MRLFPKPARIAPDSFSNLRNLNAAPALATVPSGHQRQRFRRGAIVAAQIVNIRLERHLSGLHRADDRAGRADRQELALDACARGVKAAEKLIRPGTLIRDLNNAAFAPYVEAGPLRDAEARTMPCNRSAAEDGGPREIRREYAPHADYEAQGRRLTHVYPATFGPQNPNLGHAVGMAGGRTPTTSPPTTATGWRRG